MLVSVCVYFIFIFPLDRFFFFSLVSSGLQRADDDVSFVLFYSLNTYKYIYYYALIDLFI